MYFTGHQYPLDNMLNLKVKSSCKVKIKLPQDEESSRISSCAFLAKGELLLVDHNNCSLKLLDRALVLQNCFDLSPNRPWDVSAVDNSTVVVTLPRRKMLQFIQIYPSFSRGRSVKFDKECCGVAVSAEHIYVTCHNNDGVKKEDRIPGKVCILDRRGNEIRRIKGSNDDKLGFIKPDYVAVNKDGSTIYVSDMATNTITALRTTGDILFQYTTPDTYSDLWSIEQMYIDSQSNILVCGRGTHNVQIITAAGQKYKTMLISSDGLRLPEGIAYRPSDGTLVVGCEQDDLCVFNLVHTQEMIPATLREHISGRKYSSFNKDVKIK